MRWYLYRRSKFKIMIPLAALLIIFLILLKSLFNVSNLPDICMPASGAAPTDLYFTMQSEDVDLPDELMVYKYQNEAFTEHDVAELAERLDLNGKIFYNSENRQWSVSASGRILVVEQQSGMWNFRDIGSRYGIDAVSRIVPSDDDVLELAKDYLNKVGIEAEEFSSVGIGTTTENNTVTAKSVYFYQQVDGYEVVGASRLVVDIGHQGKLEGITKYYKEIEEDKVYKLKSVRQAMAELKSGQAGFQIPESIQGQAKVYEVRLAYYEESGCSLENHYLQPIYLFTGEVETEEGYRLFSAAVPAVKGVKVKQF